MFEIYAYGNVDTLTGVFNAIAAIMGGDDYFGLVKTVAVTGVLVAAFAGLFTPGRFHGWSWLIGFINNTTEPVYKMLAVANAVPGSNTAETLIETYKDVIALDYAETFLNRAIRQAMSALSQSLKRTAIEQQYVEALRGNAQEAQRQLLAEKQTAYAKVRSVSSMTQDLQTLERQLWSSMPSTVKAMLDFSANSGARGS